MTLIILLISLIIKESFEEGCKKIQWAEQPISTGRCAAYEGITFNIQKCEKKKCMFANNQVLSFCISNITLRYEGDSCSFDYECFSLNCKEKKCISIPNGGSCSVNGECSKLSYCNEKKVCQAVKGEKDECEQSYECNIELMCELANQNNTKKECRKVLSLQDGEFSLNFFLL